MFRSSNRNKISTFGLLWSMQWNILPVEYLTFSRFPEHDQVRLKCSIIFISDFYFCTDSHLLLHKISLLFINKYHSMVRNNRATLREHIVQSSMSRPEWLLHSGMFPWTPRCSEHLLGRARPSGKRSLLRAGIALFKMKSYFRKV